MIPYYTNLPHNRLYPAQQIIANEFYKSQTLTLFMSRQTGKSNVSCAMVFNRIINESRNGYKYMIMGPSEGKIGELFIRGVLLEAFGGAEEVTDADINNVFIPMPDKYYKQYSAPKYQKITDGYIKDGRISADLKWIKLFFNDIRRGGRSNDGEQYQGMLFTGASITFTSSNNPFISRIIRGNTFNGIWIDEIGEANNDIRPLFKAALDSKFGWVLYTGTPAKDPKNNWVYDSMISPLLDNPNVKRKFFMGLTFFDNSTYIFGQNEQDKINIGQYTIIGKLEDLWQVVYKGYQKVQLANKDRESPYSPQFILDENGEKIPDDNFTITKSDGSKKVYGYQYKMIPNQDLNISKIIGISEEAYQREYQMSFSNISNKVFPSFGLANILDSTEFNPNLYKTIVGFDYGSKDRKNNTKIKDRSSTAWAKVAIIPNANTFQYVVYDCGYIDIPNEEHISKFWLETINSGYPIVADRAIWNNTVYEGSSNYSVFVNANEELKRNRLKDTNVGIFKCFKWNSNINKARKFDEYFGLSYAQNTEIRNNLDDNRKINRKVMITNNCLELIKFFNTSDFVNKSIAGTSSVEQSLKEVNDDIYDAMTYAIDEIEKKTDGWKNILKFYNKYETSKFSEVRDNQNNNFMNDMMKMFGVR